MEADVAFFFVSYLFIASIVLLNVIVALLLDEFISSVTREKVGTRHTLLLAHNPHKTSS
jgi:hypothetical protein